MNDTDLNLFIAFEVIYNERNLTKAGEVLGITQPAVSNALSRLRDLFDDELFVRTSKGMVPTAVAQNIAKDIKEGLAHFLLLPRHLSHAPALLQVRCLRPQVAIHPLHQSYEDEGNHLDN